MISIDLQEATLHETLESFADIGGGELAIDPAVEGRVTLKSSGPLWKILDRICRDHDLSCFWENNPIRLSVKPGDGFEGFAGAVSLSLRDAKFQEVMTAFEAITEGRLRLAGDFTGEVSVEIHAMPWPVVLEQLCAEGGCEVAWDTDPITVTAGPGRTAGTILDFGEVSAAGGPTPTMSLEPPTVELRVRDLDGKFHDRTSVLSWRRPFVDLPLRGVEDGTSQTGVVAGAWIPLGPDRQWVVPMWAPCGGDPVLFSPVPVRNGRASASLDVRFGRVSLGEEDEADPCPGEASPAPGVLLEEWQRSRFVRRSHLPFSSHRGSWVRIGPPSPAPGEGLAVIYLGPDRAGESRFAVLRAEEGEAPRLVERSAGPMESLRLESREYRLTLEG